MLQDWNPSQYNFKIITLKHTQYRENEQSYATASGTHNNNRTFNTLKQ